MSSMGVVSVADKVSAVKKYLSGKESHASIAREYGVSRSTFAPGINVGLVAVTSLVLWGVYRMTLQKVSRMLGVEAESKQ